MTFTGSTYSRLYNWVADRDANINILAERMDGEMDGFTTAINQIMQGQIPFTGAVKLSIGAASAPALSFATDTDTGLYRIGANNLGMSVAGSLAFDLSTSRLLLNKALKVEVTGNVASGTSNHGAFIKGPTPTLTMIDTDLNGGASQWQFQGGVLYLLGDTDNDELIGSTANGSDEEWLKISTTEFKYKGLNIWHSGSDGDGSGLDADLLDGQHGSHYLSYANMTDTIGNDDLPTTITKNTSGTHSGPSTGNHTGNFGGFGVAAFWRNDNDGSGSGLDADLLDGQHGSSYLRSNSNDQVMGLIDFSRASDQQMRVGYNTGASRNSYIDIYDGLTTRRGYIQGRSGLLRILSQAGAQLDMYGSGDVRINGSRILRQADEGSGNGIDADTVDGLHATSFSRASESTYTPTFGAVSLGYTITRTTLSRAKYREDGDMVHVNVLVKLAPSTGADDEAYMTLPVNALDTQLVGACWMSINRSGSASDVDDHLTADGAPQGITSMGMGIVRGNRLYFKTNLYQSIGTYSIDQYWLYVTMTYRKQ